MNDFQCNVHILFVRCLCLTYLDQREKMLDTTSFSAGVKREDGVPFDQHKGYVGGHGSRMDKSDV